MVRRAFLMAGTGASFIMLATLAVFNLYAILVEHSLGVTEQNGTDRSGAERCDTEPPSANVFLEQGL